MSGFGRKRSPTWLQTQTKALLARSRSLRGRHEKGNAQVLSDLAAAYAERACRDHAPYDLVRALNNAELAVNQDPALPEALFNRALILERLHLKSQARGAWKRYRAIRS